MLIISAPRRLAEAGASLGYRVRSDLKNPDDAGGDNNGDNLGLFFFFF